MSSGERPTGAAKGDQTNTVASCHTPPPPRTLPAPPPPPPPRLCAPALFSSQSHASPASACRPPWRYASCLTVITVPSPSTTEGAVPRASPPAVASRTDLFAAPLQVCPSRCAGGGGGARWWFGGGVRWHARPSRRALGPETRPVSVGRQGTRALACTRPRPLAVPGALGRRPSRLCPCGRATGGQRDSTRGGFGKKPWYCVLVCSWRRPLADRHSLAFPSLSFSEGPPSRCFGPPFPFRGVGAGPQVRASSPCPTTRLTTLTVRF